jgi:hypothetical protein
MKAWAFRTEDGLIILDFRKGKEKLRSPYGTQSSLETFQRSYNELCPLDKDGQSTCTKWVLRRI